MCVCISVSFSVSFSAREFNPLQCQKIYLYAHNNLSKIRILYHEIFCNRWTMYELETEELREKRKVSTLWNVCAFGHVFDVFHFHKFQKIMHAWIKICANKYIHQCVNIYIACALSSSTYISNGISIGEEQVSDNASNKQLRRCINMLFFFFFFFDAT